MKLSNKLLIGFVGFIFLYLSAAFIEIRFKGDHEDLDSEDAITESVPITNVRFIKINNVDTHISISSSDKPRIEIRSMNGGLIESMDYIIHNDTLEINRIERTSVRKAVVLYAPNEIVSIKVKRSRVSVSNLDLHSIAFELIDAAVSLDENIRVDSMRVAASNDSNFNASNSEVESLSVDLNNSNAFLYTEIRRIEGTVSKSSRLILSGAGQINVKKDASSTITWMEDVDAVIRMENN